MNIERGGVYLAALDPTMGHEISKTRPVLVISNDINNQYAGTVTVLPVTSRGLEKVYPFETLLPKGTANLPKDSKVKADQIRTLDKRRIIKFIGSLSGEDIAGLENALSLHLGLAQG